MEKFIEPTVRDLLTIEDLRWTTRAVDLRRREQLCRDMGRHVEAALRAAEAAHAEAQRDTVRKLARRAASF